MKFEYLSFARRSIHFELDVVQLERAKPRFPPSNLWTVEF